MAISDRLPALQYRDFRNFILGSFVSNIGSSVQLWAVAWHVYHLTGDSLMVGLLHGLRIVPLVIFSLLGGVVADNHDRRKILIVTQTVMAVISLAIAATTLSGHASVWVLIGLVTLNAIPISFNNPARQAFMANMVPKSIFSNAASVNGIQWRLSDVLGPMIAGLLIALPIGPMKGLAVCYALNAVSFLSMIYAVWILPARPVENAGRMSVAMVLSSIQEGLRFVWRKPILRDTMVIDFWATLLSGAEALYPAFATILMLGPAGYGMLAASSGLGALAAAVVLAWLPPIQKQGKWVLGMIACYGLFTIAFGLSPNLILAVIFLAATGAADMISTVLRQTIRQLTTPDEIRGRMSATSMIFNIAGPRLGDLEAGIVARLIGERLSVVTGGVGCILVAAFFGWRAKELRAYVHDHDPVEAPQ